MTKFRMNPLLRYGFDMTLDPSSVGGSQPVRLAFTLGTGKSTRIQLPSKAVVLAVNEVEQAAQKTYAVNSPLGEFSYHRVRLSKSLTEENSYGDALSPTSSVADFTADAAAYYSALSLQPTAALPDCGTSYLKQTFSCLNLMNQLIPALSGREEIEVEFVSRFRTPDSYNTDGDMVPMILFSYELSATEPFQLRLSVRQSDSFSFFFDLRMTTESGDMAYFYSDLGVLQPATWYYVVLKRFGNVFKLFLDGSLVGVFQPESRYKFDPVVTDDVQLTVGQGCSLMWPSTDLFYTRLNSYNPDGRRHLLPGSIYPIITGAQQTSATTRIYAEDLVSGSTLSIINLESAPTYCVRRTRTTSLPHVPDVSYGYYDTTDTWVDVDASDYTTWLPAASNLTVNIEPLLRDDTEFFELVFGGYEFHADLVLDAPETSFKKKSTEISEELYEPVRTDETSDGQVEVLISNIEDPGSTRSLELIYTLTD